MNKSRNSSSIKGADEISSVTRSMDGVMLKDAVDEHFSCAPVSMEAATNLIIPVKFSRGT